MSTDRPAGSEPEPYPGEQPYPGQQPYPSQPAPYSGYGSPGGTQGPDPAWPGSTAPPYPGTTGQWPTEPMLSRPTSVTGAVVLSWIGGGVFAVLGLLALLLARNGDFLSGIETSIGHPIDQTAMSSVLRGLGALILIWGVAVLLGATFAWRRRKWARIVLTVLGAIYCIVQLVGVLSGAIAAVLPVLWVAAAVVLLWTRASSDWFAGRSSATTASYDVRPPQPW